MTVTRNIAIALTVAMTTTKAMIISMNEFCCDYKTVAKSI